MVAASAAKSAAERKSVYRRGKKTETGREREKRMVGLAKGAEPQERGLRKESGTGITQTDYIIS